MVIWIIGLSGSGKTTLAQRVISDINNRSNTKKTILIDGDDIREVFGNDIGYSKEDRLINAKRICRLGKFLNDQGINVVCAILSLFPESQEWNRENIEDYFEVFLDVPIDVLIDRDSKGIYGKYNRGEISQVAGMDIKFPTPKNADMIIKPKSLLDLVSHSDYIVGKLCQTNQ